jgi:hypothetical protein
MKRASGSSAELLLRDGLVWTGDAAAPWAEAALIRNGRFVFVGRESDINAPAGTPVFDVGGRLVLPGLIEGHAHLYGTGAALEHLNLKGSPNLDDALGRVAAQARATPRGQWITGDGWDQNIWPERAMPDARALDAAAPDHPVCLTHTSIHIVWANTAALREAGVTGATAVPPGGAIDADERGEPTGILREAAMQLVVDVIPRPSPADRERAMTGAMKHAHRHGLTGFHAMEVGEGEWEAMRAMRESGALKLRARAYLTATRLDEWIERGLRAGDGDEWLAVGGIKFFADGALGPLTAWMLEPFEGTNNRGMALRPPSEIEAMVEKCLKNGLAPCIHAIGDRANREMLDVMERTRAIAPELSRRIEHAQLVAPEDLPRFGALAIAASAQPIHCTQDMAKVDRALAERGRGAYAFATLRRGGANLAFGSDAPVETICPIAGIHAAVTRRTAKGEPRDGWRPEERLTLDETIEAYTLGCARATGEEGRQGRIAPGHFGDFTVLSENIFDLVDPMKMLEARVEATIVGGEIVYRAERGLDLDGRR